MSWQAVTKLNFYLILQVTFLNQSLKEASNQKRPSMGIDAIA